MLQMKDLTYAAHNDVARGNLFPPQWTGMEELQDVTMEWMDMVFRHRSRLAKEEGVCCFIQDKIDRAIHTNEPEYLDQPDFPQKNKVKMVKALHATNSLIFAYRRYKCILAPYILKCAERAGRSARVLELASGSGEFAFTLARLAQRTGLPVEITGSDYIQKYVDTGNNQALKRNLPVTFRRINAFDMTSVDEGAYDLVITTQSMHHFTPGQLAMMIAQSCRVATTAFVGLDGYRSLLLLCALPITSALSLRSDLVHDALISARRFYSNAELDIIASIAVQGYTHSCNYHFPGVSSLVVSFNHR